MSYITVKQLIQELQAIPEELHDEEVRIMTDHEEIEGCPDSLLKAVEVRLARYGLGKKIYRKVKEQGYCGIEAEL